MIKIKDIIIYALIFITIYLFYENISLNEKYKNQLEENFEYSIKVSKMAELVKMKLDSCACGL